MFSARWHFTNHKFHALVLFVFITLGLQIEIEVYLFSHMAFQKIQVKLNSESDPYHLSQLVNDMGMSLRLTINTQNYNGILLIIQVQIIYQNDTTYSIIIFL